MLLRRYYYTGRRLLALAPGHLVHYLRHACLLRQHYLHRLRALQAASCILWVGSRAFEGVRALEAASQWVLHNCDVHGTQRMSRRKRCAPHPSRSPGPKGCEAASQWVPLICDVHGTQRVSRWKRCAPHPSCSPGPQVLAIVRVAGACVRVHLVVQRVQVACEVVVVVFVMLWLRR